MEEKKNAAISAGNRYGRWTLISVCEDDDRKGETNGRKVNCRKKIRKKGRNRADITKQRFGRLVALYPTEKRNKKGSVIWHCRCDCGKELDISHNELVYSNVKSCGCLRKEHDMKLKEFLAHVDGTFVNILRSKKIPSDNTTGYKGVYLIKNKYVAKIVFQKKAYYLGAYEKIEDAVKIRSDAEKLLFEGTASFYEKWKERAESDPVWAKENPIQIQVTKDDCYGLKISYSPEI